mmetsp:Transcript_11479/g.49462  ORF Transcript_11479/g.49462 Transcript_11479/m.49462 type:complete len:611 (+) Transcript_11479:46-1878(+)
MCKSYASILLCTLQEHLRRGNHHRRHEHEQTPRVLQDVQPEEHVAQRLAERERAVLHGVLQRRGNVRADPGDAVDHDGLHVAAPAEALDAREAIEPALLDAAERERLRHVRGAEIVDGGHARVELGAHLERSARAAEDVGTEAKVAFVRERHRLVVAANLDDGEDGPEHLLLHDLHRVVHVREHGGGIELARGVLVDCAAALHLGALGDGVVDEALHVRSLVGHAHRAAVHARGEGPTLPELVRRLHHPRDELVVDLLVNVKPLGTRAVLAARLKRASERHRDALRETGVLEHDERILAAELEDHGGEGIRRRLHHHATDARGPDKDNLVRAAGDESVARFAVAVDDLDQIFRRAHGLEARLDGATVVERGPRGVLRNLHDQGVTREHVGEQRIEHVVEGIVPRDNRAHDADWVVLDAGVLVEHHETGGPFLGLEPLLAFFNQPLALLERHDDLAERGVDEGLAGVPRGDLADGVLILEDEPLDGLDEQAALLERGLGPLLLRDTRALDLNPHLISVVRGHVGAEHLERAGIVARDEVLGERRAGLPALAGQARLLLLRELDVDLGHPLVRDEPVDGVDEAEDDEVANAAHRVLRLRERHQIGDRNDDLG